MAKKEIRAARCIHMPAPANTVVIFSSKHGETFKAGFTIGVQDFTIAERETKEEAQWYCDMLEKAFTNLITPPVVDKLQSDENKKMVMNNLPIKVKNLR